MTNETPATARVVMLWPVGLKQQVRELVGQRGTTAFTILAVQKHLADVLAAGAVPAEAAVEPAVIEAAEPAEVESGAPVDMDACPKCGAALVGGECWTCD